MLTAIIIFILSFALIAWAAERFVTGAAALAVNLGISPLLIGLTIVALGTSAPEIFVSLSAAWHNNPGIAIGNAIGSNIANIGLVIGIVALIAPLKVQSRILRREYPILIGIMLLAWLLLSNGELNRIDGVILLAGLIGLIAWLLWEGKNSKRPEPLADEFREELSTPMPTHIALFWCLLGLVLLPISSEGLVYSAIFIAKTFGVSDLVIGLTIIAIGTSLPEVATSISACLKGEPDIALGNVIGSNMFNILAVLPLPGLIAPGSFNPHVLTRDIPVMVGFTFILFFLFYGFRGVSSIRRWQGGLLLTLYGSYLFWIYHSLQI